MAHFDIDYANGEITHASSKRKAIDTVRARYPDMVVNDDNPYRIYVWSNESDSDNDDGSKAVAVIMQAP